MKKLLKNLIGLVIFCLLGGPLAAQEKIDATSLKSKEAKEKLKNAPAALEQTISQSLKDIGKAVSNKLGMGSKETKNPTAAENESSSPAEKKALDVPTAQVLPVGRRDPFRPFTLNTRAAPMRKRDHLAPLERFELGQLKLVGVVADTRNSNALVEDSSGLGYVVKVGTPIGSNDGKVVAIKREGIVIEEIFVDLYGAQKKREVSMKLTAENAE